MPIEKLNFESKSELEQMVTQEFSQIDKNLTVICSDVPINDNATLDILCHDDNGQLVIVQMSIDENDIMLLHGIQSLDYIDKFKSFLKATYSKNNINDKEKPRMIMIAPSFSDAVKRAVESMKGIQVDLYEWEYLKLGEHKGLRLQPVFASKPIEKPKAEEKQPEKKHSKRKEQPEPEKTEEPTVTDYTTEPEATADEQPEQDAASQEQESKDEQKRKLRLF